jgi:uncharacterized protein YggE
MKSKKVYLILVFLAFYSSYGQISGNSVYGNNRYSNENQKSFSLTDNALTFKVKVMMNKKADRLTITLGVNEEASTVATCNSQINKRINDFIAQISKIGIKRDAIYVDFISQTKVFDYTLSTNKAEEFEKGFEIKKNIIIATNNLKNIDAIIETASQFKIYDIIKVDYFADNTNEIYNTLFDDALKIAESKKNKYLKSFSKRSVGNPSATDEFTIITPESQYKKYEAFEGSELQTYYDLSNAVMKKIARKNKTFYYDGIAESDFDKVINSGTSEVGMQFIVTLTITYKLDTSL